MAIGLVALIAFIYFVGAENIVSTLLSVNPIIVVLMVALQLLGFGFYSTAWYILILAAGYRMRYLTCLGVTLASIFAVYTMPSGVFLEAARCVLGSKETGMKLGESTSTVILHRILYIVGFLACTALALFALLSRGSTSSIDLVELASIPTVTIFGLVVLLYFSSNPQKIRPVLNRLLRFLQPIVTRIQRETVVEGKADRFLDEYNSGFKRMVSSRRHMVMSFLSSIGDWGCSVAILWIVLLSLDTSISLWVVMITISIGKMIQMTPIAIPGMLGVYETAITTVLALFAVPVSIGAAAALLSRIVTVWLELPVTGVAAYHYGYKLVTKGTPG
ncbi:MAG TPA: flippase-like domain-containing protein [Candidatus Acidoferrales bacterium]|nr:flippase-like domain-containing protein [Candidatus Acidoferrales bacterium]